jgi:hypothetical protein
MRGWDGFAEKAIRQPPVGIESATNPVGPGSSEA